MSSDIEFDWRRNLAVCLVGSFAIVFATTLILPFLPIFVEKLGVRGEGSIAQWSGIVYGANFLTAGLLAPVWGYLGDRYGRKAMLVRASLGSVLTLCLMGLVTNVWQLVALRLLSGVVGGYASGATILIALQAPKARSVWALGLLSAGGMTGTLLGPLVGGILPPLVGIRATFWSASALIFLVFLMTAFLVQEAPRGGPLETNSPRQKWSEVSQKQRVVALLATGLLLMIANMSVEPIITIYISALTHHSEKTTFIAGMAMSAAALGSIISAALLGKIANIAGHSSIVVLALSCAGLLLLPQAFVTNSWQLVALRFLMGLSLGVLLPCIAIGIRYNVPDHFVGTAMGYSLSSQFAGQVVGPLIGGFIAGHIGMRAVFVGTSILMFLGALYNLRVLGLSSSPVKWA